MIVVRIWEGLGNQMFQYAYARMLQQISSTKVYLEGRRIYRERLPQEDLSVERKCAIHHFNLTVPFIKPKYLTEWSYLGRNNMVDHFKWQMSKCGMLRYSFRTDEEDMYAYQESLLAVKDNTYVMGHFFHRKYIEPIRTILLREFTLKKEQKFPAHLAGLMEQKETVSVHLRRGGYVYAECAQAMNKEMRRGRYYERAMNEIAAKVEHPFFLFFSDDIAWVKEHVPCVYPHAYVSDFGLSDYKELMLMSQCRHNIIANSTFSFWGAWLNQFEGKIVIAPKRWMPSVIPKDWMLI